MFDLKEKVAIITGGSQGVGKGIALALCKAGAKVAISARTETRLQDAQKEIQQAGGEVLTVAGDVSKQADRERLVKATLERFGRIDILVNNAAVVPHGTLLEIGDDLIESAWQAGPIASLQLMRLCHPHLKKNGGAIINVSSAVTLANNAPQRGIYAAVKSALSAISRAAANEWGKDGIRVNTIMPFANTDAVAAYFKNEPKHAAGVLAGVPLGRVGDPETDIGAGVVFLASDNARYLTGATLPLDGGAAFLR